MEDNMEKVLLHTPEGVRDVYGKEFYKKMGNEIDCSHIYGILSDIFCLP